MSLTESYSYSYKYVERSVQHGMLEDPEVHRVGPSASRPMGATQIPKKGTRSDYSLKDDQIVYDWVYPFEQEPGAPISGNKIYQALEREVGRDCPSLARSYGANTDLMIVSSAYMAVLAVTLHADLTGQAASWGRRT